MTEDFWADKYPSGLARTIDPELYRNVLVALRASCARFAKRPAFSSLGKTLTYADLYRLSGYFAAWLQNNTDLKPGDRIAVQLPNLLQYPVVVFGALRAGLIVVNTNPLYTAREMEHQFVDAEVRALVCLNTTAHSVAEILPRTQIQYVLISEVGDLLNPWKRVWVNAAVKYLKKKVRPYQLPQAIALRTALHQGRGQSLQEHDPDPEDVAILQYTGGTTGVAKGAMLTHRNLIANMLQCRAIMSYGLEDGQEVMVAPLPLYHVYAFTLHCMVGALIGSHSLLIADPRDMPAFIKILRRYPFSIFIGLNTLFAALCHRAEFRALDFSHLKASFSGGMALQQSTALEWQEITGCAISEGYGMTETSPVVAVNPFQNIQLGTIGIPVPSTDCKIIDEQGVTLAPNSLGELCVRGPQVMKGYWQRPDETAQVLDAEGWIKTGDIALIQPDGYIRIVDRKKDMILVSGFNVYPNELEEVLAVLPEVLHSAAIGIPDPHSGEAIKIFVVVKPGMSLTHEQVMQHMHVNLTGYKRPKYVEFRDSLPVTNVGKILRRALRTEEH